jgi:DNA-binding transcriptional ArsR family regulator
VVLADARRLDSLYDSFDSEHVYCGVPAPAPSLLPIFRSETQARVLAEVFFGVPVTGRELARRLRVPQPTVARELGRLEGAGLVEYEQVGNAKIVRPASVPYRDALRQLVAYAAGAPQVVRAEYEGVEGVSEVFIHGSWAARFHGRSGPPPNDLDLVIVSESHTRFSLAEHRAAIEAVTGMTVDQMILPPGHDRLPALRQGSVPVLIRPDDG